MNREIENWIYLMLEDESLEDLLERFNIDPVTVFEVLLESGHIDEDLLEDMVRLD